MNLLLTNFISVACLRFSTAHNLFIITETLASINLNSV